MGAEALHKTAKLGLGTHQLAAKEVARLNALARKKPAGAGERRTLTAYLDACVCYFAERGMDPFATQAREGAYLFSEIRRLGDRVFAYLQDQEQHVHQAVLQELVRSRVTQQVVLAVVQDVEGKLNGLTTDVINATRKQDTDRIERNVAKVMQALEDAASAHRSAARADKKGNKTATK